MSICFRDRRDDLLSPLLAELLTEADATELARLLKALADPARLRIVSAIAASPAGEVCACDLPALLERTQSTTSHHLSQLVKSGVLVREQRGKWAWFRIDNATLASLAGALASPAGSAGSR